MRALLYLDKLKLSQPLGPSVAIRHWNTSTSDRITFTSRSASSSTSISDRSVENPNVEAAGRPCTRRRHGTRRGGEDPGRRPRSGGPGEGRDLLLLPAQGGQGGGARPRRRAADVHRPAPRVRRARRRGEAGAGLRQGGPQARRRRSEERGGPRRRPRRGGGEHRGADAAPAAGDGEEEPARPGEARPPVLGLRRARHHQAGGRQGRAQGRCVICCWLLLWKFPFFFFFPVLFLCYICDVTAGGARAWLFAEEYSTATRGQRRRRPAARALGEGVYRILKHGEPGGGRRAPHTHLVYKLELPPRGGGEPPQDALNVEPEASFLVQVKNPDPPSAGAGFRGLQEKRRAAFPARLQGAFGTRRYAPADPPDLLNYEGCELLLIAASDDVEEELGLELEGEQDAARCSDLVKMFGEVADVKPLLSGTWD